MRVLFVCSGNVCRSPMAAEYARRRFAADGLLHVAVESAGTLGIEGFPASAEARRVTREYGLDLEHHRSRGITAADLRTADLVVVMELRHLEELERYPTFPGQRRLLLRAFEHGPDPEAGAPDLDDPMGEPLEVYQRCMKMIRESVDHLSLHLKRLE